jgi:hypothetical protein
VSIRWRGGNWTAGNWDANNWLGPNEPPPPGSISGSTSITITLSGTLTAAPGAGFMSGSTSITITATGRLTATGTPQRVEQTPFAGMATAHPRRHEERYDTPARIIGMLVMLSIPMIEAIEDEEYSQ